MTAGEELEEEVEERLEEGLEEKRYWGEIGGETG